MVNGLKKRHKCDQQFKSLMLTIVLNGLIEDLSYHPRHTLHLYVLIHNVLITKKSRQKLHPQICKCNFWREFRQLVLFKLPSISTKKIRIGIRLPALISISSEHLTSFDCHIFRLSFYELPPERRYWFSIAKNINSNFC